MRVVLVWLSGAFFSHACMQATRGNAWLAVFDLALVFVYLFLALRKATP